MSAENNCTTPNRCIWCEMPTRIEGKGRGDKLAWAECPHCGASGPAKTSKAAAAGAWNRVWRWAAAGKAAEEAKTKGDAA